MIETVDEVLKPTATSWRVATNDPVLRPFLARGGDYTFLVSCPELLDEVEPNGGNLIAWRVEGDTVVLSHADTDSGPECRIKRAVLEEVMSILAEARGESAGKPTPVVGPASERAPRTRTKKKSNVKKRVALAAKRGGKKRGVAGAIERATTKHEKTLRRLAE